MNEIVVVTTPGAAKRDFVNVLHQRTGGAVKLVIIQIPKARSFSSRLSSLLRKRRLSELPAEMFHLLSVKLSDRKKRVLTAFKAYTQPTDFQKRIVPPVIETTDINDPEVLEAVRSIRPAVLAIWGGGIIKREILEAAGFAINIHAGYCPYYRGANGNQQAVLRGDFRRIGITIHRAVPEVDAGEIITTIGASHDIGSDPFSYFRDLNDRATEAYLETIINIARGEKPRMRTQDLSLGKNYKNREWTYAKADALAKQLLKWNQPVVSIKGP